MQANGTEGFSPGQRPPVVECAVKYSFWFRAQLIHQEFTK